MLEERSKKEKALTGSALERGTKSPVRKTVMKNRKRRKGNVLTSAKKLGPGEKGDTKLEGAETVVKKGNIGVGGKAPLGRKK